MKKKINGPIKIPKIRKTTIKTTPIIREIIKFFRTQTALANTLGISQSAVTQMVKRKRIPAKWAKQIERLSKGNFKARDIRPDIFG